MLLTVPVHILVSTVSIDLINIYYEEQPIVMQEKQKQLDNLTSGLLKPLTGPEPMAPLQLKIPIKIQF